MVKKTLPKATIDASLKSYRAKRDFRKSPEPAGEIEAVKAAEPAAKVEKEREHAIFVVHKHAASRLHYDLRLEHEGILSSWAIPKGPSLDPLENRLSVRVEDHPLSYREFEGCIPAGNYGAGTMMIWDSGTYSLYETLPRESHEQAFARQYRKGNLKLELQGVKLQGRFALVCTDKGGGKGGSRNWLLLKKRDAHAARRDVLLEERSVFSGRTMAEITEANTVLPLGSKQKMQGDKSAAAEKKQSKPKLQKLPPAAKKQKIPEKWAAMNPKKASAAQGPGLAQTLHQTLAQAAQGLWQALAPGLPAYVRIRDGKVEVRTMKGLNLTPRCAQLTSELSILPDETLILGIIELQRARVEFHAFDLLWYAGRALAPLPLVERWNHLGKIWPLSDLTALLEAVPDPSSATAGSPGAGAGRVKHWWRNWDAPYVFGGVCDDWLEFDRLGQSAGQIANSAQTSGPAKSSRVILTNGKKIFFLDEGFSKGDVFEYYRLVAPVLLKHLRDRPQSMNRHPNGIHGESFFQKEASGSVPGWVETANVASYSGRKTVSYVLCQDLDTLLFLVNMGCIEINPWLARVPDLDRPDFAVIDIDPGSLPFAKVIEGALVIREVLESLGAIAYCKTSGGRGLHIYLPSDGGATFADCQEFAEHVGKRMSASLPQLASIERSPLRRRDKLYVDSLQNRRGQTMAAVYSIRPRAGALVSAPIAWEELHRALDPAAFTLKTMPARIEAKGDLWSDLFEASQQNDIRALLEQLKRKDTSTLKARPRRAPGP